MAEETGILRFLSCEAASPEITPLTAGAAHANKTKTKEKNLENYSRDVG